MKHNKFIVCLCVSILFLVFPLCSAQATVVSLNMNTVFSGSIPTNTPPWLNATFDDGGSSGSVVLTITASGMTADEKVNEVLFNLDPALNLANLTFSAPTKTGTFEDPTISKGTDSFKADGDGYYDILIAFNTDGPSNAFNGQEAVKYTITLGSLTANSFNFTSASGGGQGTYVTAAQLQNIDAQGNSAWVTTPEPATMCLLGLGAFALRRKK